MALRHARFGMVKLLASIGVLLAIASPAGAAAVLIPPAELPVLVRADCPSVDQSLIQDVLNGAREIWRPYVTLSFRGDYLPKPSNPSNLANSSNPSNRDDALHLILTDQTVRPGDADSLGWITFKNGRPSRTVTVSMTSAQVMMQGARWRDVPMLQLPLSVRRTFLVRALSRAVAHEIGHYLLRSSEHSAGGLMRDHLSGDEIMQGSRANDRLERADIDKLKRRLVEYAESMRWEKDPA